MKLTLAALAGIAGLGLAASSANALPASGASNVATPDSLVEKTHGWHTSCQSGPAGWHYHSRRDGRVACVVRPTGNFWLWTFRDGRYGWWHRNERRWHH